MDSLTQAALGAAVGVAALGRRAPMWKAAAWGALAGTLPDLDALIDHGDAVANMTRHRAESHALFWLTLAAPVLGAAAARLAGEASAWRRWIWATWLVLVTHPLLDAMTVYGTQLLLPFTDHPYGLGSIFIIDPLYTLPLLAGLAMAARAARAGDGARARRLNATGLALSSAYLAWTVVAQAWVQRGAEQALAQSGVRAEALLVTPAPFSTLLWRVVAVEPSTDRFHEGFRSLLDGPQAWRFDRFVRGEALGQGFEASAALQRMRWFTRGLYKLQPGRGDSIVITDLRMGQEPSYVFAFELARPGSGPAAVRPVGGRLDVARGLQWLGPRMLGQALPPPR